MLQAAAALAQLASDHAHDPQFDSPYTIEAAQEGFDIPIWEKVGVTWACNRFMVVYTVHNGSCYRFMLGYTLLLASPHFLLQAAADCLSGLLVGIVSELANLGCILTCLLVSGGWCVTPFFLGCSVQLFSASIKDGKVQLGKLTGGKLDDITCLVAYVEAIGSS